MNKWLLSFLMVPSFALAQGLHGNQAKLYAGVFLGDNDIDGFSTDDIYNYGVKVKYFISDPFYIIGGFLGESATYSAKEFEQVDLSAFIAGIEVGLGYEVLIQPTLSIFTEGELFLGGGQLKLKNTITSATASFDYSAAGLTSIFGVRGRSSDFLWEAAAGFRSMFYDYDDLIDDESTFNAALRIGAGYYVTDAFSVAARLLSDVRSHLLSANLSYHF